MQQSFWGQKYLMRCILLFVTANDDKDVRAAMSTMRHRQNYKKITSINSKWMGRIKNTAAAGHANAVKRSAEVPRIEAKIARWRGRPTRMHAAQHMISQHMFNPQFYMQKYDVRSRNQIIIDKGKTKTLVMWDCGSLGWHAIWRKNYLLINFWNLIF